MQLLKFRIEYFRSIQKIDLIFPKNRPLILFGPNNVGKSNVLKALDCMLGEKWTPYYDFQDSDHFERNSDENPNISFTSRFDGNIYPGNSYNDPSDIICFTTKKDFGDKEENTFHNTENKKLYITSENRSKCQFILIDATRDITRQLSYYSQYSILSRMSQRMHKAMQSSVKDKLAENFKEIKTIFETVPEYKSFYNKLQTAFGSNIEGFKHKLEIDLSAYDPNNYFHSLKIIAKEGEDVRSFEEFGTGEQQILLMSFVKAYAETFKGESFILGIEEPESHLHPIAQKWLSKNINSFSKSGIQIVITTHSPEFLDIDNLEGFVKLYKEDGVTKAIQNTPKILVDKCVELGVAPENISEENIVNFYKTKTFYDQLRGFFSEKIILVEGETELFALQNYFNNCGYDLIRDGVEVINCRGKSQITRNYRLFRSYGYECFCVFDADNKECSNSDFSRLFGFKEEGMSFRDNEFTFDTTKKYGYFGKDFESYLRSNIPNYSTEEAKIEGGKVLKAKILSENSTYKPEFIHSIASSLSLTKLT